MDISESDLEEIGFKQSHRRHLQRAIWADREQSGIAPLEMSGGRIKSDVGKYRRLENHEYQNLSISTANTYTTCGRSLRDPNAPSLPRSRYHLYVLFLLQNKEVANLSAVDIAGLTRQQWQCLGPNEVAGWTERAAEGNAQYEVDFARYMKTAKYQKHLEYQTHLEDLGEAHITSTGGDERRSGDEDPETGTSHLS